MNLEQWNLAINNASNIWMAGIMTVQTLLIALTLFLGYNQYKSFLKQALHPIASKLYKQDKKFIKIVYDVYSKKKTMSEMKGASLLEKLSEPKDILLYDLNLKWILNRYKKAKHCRNDMNQLQHKMRLNLEKINDKRIIELHDMKMQILISLNKNVYELIDTYLEKAENNESIDLESKKPQFNELYNSIPHDLYDMENAKIKSFWEVQTNFNSILKSYMKIGEI